MSHLRPRYEQIARLKVKQAYVPGLTNTQIAIEAGYSQRSAYSQIHELLKKPEIKARIKELQAVVEAEFIMSVEERKATLTAIARGEHVEVTTITDKTGTTTRETKGKDRVAATAELNKMGGDYAPVKVQDVTPPKPFSILMGNMLEAGLFPGVSGLLSQGQAEDEADSPKEDKDAQ